MRFRETNHLRKLANESGKLMRSGLKARKFDTLPDPQCATCGYKQSSHHAVGQTRDWLIKNGMCEQFTEGV